MSESFPPSARLGLVFVLWLAGLGAAAQYGKVALTLDMLEGVYPDAGPALGFIVSLVGVMGILFGMTAGLLVPRIGYRRALVGGLVLGGLLSGAQAFLPPLWLMLALRVLEGASHLAIVVPIPTLIARFSPPHLMAFGLTLWGTFFGVAFTLVEVAGRPLAEVSGLSALFLTHGVYLLVFAVALAVVLPRDPENAPTAPLSFTHILWRHGQVYRTPRLAAPATVWLFYTFVYVSLLAALRPFLDPAWAAFVMGAMPLISIVSSLTIGVFLLRRMRAAAVVRLGLACSVTLALLLVLVPGDPLLCILMSGAMGLVQGAGFALVPELNATDGDRALANGGMAQSGNIGNSLGTPILLIVVAAGGYGAMMATLAAVLAMGILAFTLVTRRIA